MNKRFRLSSRIAARLKEQGVSPSEVLRVATLPPDLLDQSRILVTTEELFAFWRAVGAASHDPAIGLKLGLENNLEKYDPVSVAALCSRTLGDALRLVARYKQITCPEEILVDSSDHECSVQFRWLLAQNESEPDTLVDHCFAWILALARRGTEAQITPLRVELIQRRTNMKVLEEYFGCPVLCGAARNALVFRGRDTERPFLTHNAELLAMIAPQLDEELNQQMSQKSFPEQVRSIIQRKLAGQRPTVQQVARDLHMSSRTLQRRLQEHGFSFQQVLEKARHDLARHYLMHSLLELNETAYLLGYEDSNSFVRAFRIWEGVPPAHWRESQRAKVAS